MMTSTEEQQNIKQIRRIQAATARTSPDYNYSGMHQCVCPECGRFGWHRIFTGNHHLWGCYVCKARGDSDPWERIPEERHRDAWRHAKSLFEMYGHGPGPVGLPANKGEQREAMFSQTRDDAPDDATIEPGYTIIQVGPKGSNRPFGGCLAFVDEVKPWGVVTVVAIPDRPCPKFAYVRLNTEEFEVVGRANWPCREIDAEPNA